MNKNLIIFIFIFSFTFFQIDSLTCGHGWVQGLTADKCIRGFGESIGWSYAEQYCELWGGYLASIATGFENTMIMNYAKTAFNGSNRFWVGGNTLNARIDPYTYNWTWTDGTNMTYNNFAKNSVCVVYDDCCLTMNSNDGTWVIASCDGVATYPYLCELVTPTTAAPPTTTPWTGQCPTGWTYFNVTQMCYSLFMMDGAIYLQTFNDTIQSCRSVGAELVSVHSKEENDWITEYAYRVEDGVVWIGLYDVHGNGNWAWTDGTPVDFTNWGAGEPAPGSYSASLSSDNFSDTRNNFLPYYKSMWYGNDLDMLMAGICALPGAPTRPTPPPTTPAWSGKCDPGWEYYDQTKKCYKNIVFDDTFDDCIQWCKIVDATLATVRNPVENELLTEFLILSADNEVGLTAWLGLYSPNMDGKFQWLDGSPLNFTAWDAGEPKVGTYAALLQTHGDGGTRGKWVTYASNYLFGCFCAKDSY